MEKNFKKYLLILLPAMALSVILPSCKPKKAALTEDYSVVSANNFVKVFENKASDWTYFSSKLSVDYISDGSSMGGNATLRMKRDSAIWISVSIMGFEAARILVTQDSFYLMQKLPSKSIMIKGISELENYVGAAINLQQFQNLLLGNLILEPSAYQWRGSEDEGEFTVKGRKDSMEVTQRYFFQNIVPIKTEIKSLTAFNKATIDYSGNQATNHKDVPKGFNITAHYSPQSKPVQVKADLTAPEFPTHLTFPFTITSSYERITD